MADSERSRIPGTPWPAASDLELRHLRAFVVTAQQRHFGRAAVRLHLSQPALSRQIAKLERLVGCPLLERSSRHIELTPAGVVLLEHAQTIIVDVDRAVSSSRTASTLASDRAERFTRPLLAALESGLTLDALRSTYEAVLAGLPLPQGISVRPMPAGGVAGLVVGPDPMAITARPSVLYLHGGGYVLGSAYGFRPLAGALAMTLDRDVLVSDYRLAPEHPYPAALEDALAAYRWLLDTSPGRDLIVIGDSAGAGLALSLMLSLRSLDLPMPACAALLCPWIDPTPGEVPVSGPDRPASRSPTDSTADSSLPAPYDPDTDPADWVCEFVTRHGLLVDLDAATVNPLVTDLVGLPPLLIQTGDGDPTSRQARELVDRLTGCDQAVRWQNFPASTHVFHQYWSFLAPAVTALDELGRFVSDIAAL